MEKSEKYDCSTDIYSIGLIILILMSKQYPIYSQNGQKKDINKNLMYESFNDNLRNLVLKMVEENPNDRPKISECIFELEKII